MMILWIVGVIVAIVMVIILLASIYAFIITNLNHAKLILETDLELKELLHITQKNMLWAIEERDKSIVSHRQATDILSREYLKTAREKKIQDKKNLEDQKPDERK